MNKYEISQIGEFHVNHNEDFLVSNEIGDNKLMFAVMDGCSMGTDSHFASTIIGKLLNKISKEFHFKEFVEKQEKNIEQTLEEIIKKLFEQLAIFQNQLDLEKEELLSTLILGIVNSHDKTAEIITIGDGVINCNGILTEYEQDDKPDYLGYHLGEDFENWFKEQNQRLKLNHVNDLSIATDGIFTFKKFNNEEYDQITESEIIDFLLNDKRNQENKNMLKKKLLDLEKKFGLKPTDDLTIIRLIYT